MAPRLYNISVTKEENTEQVIQRIHRDTQLRGWTVWEGPQSLMGNFKVLRLISTLNSAIICKVEGPGFILDELYQYFSRRS